MDALVDYGGLSFDNEEFFIYLLHYASNHLLTVRTLLSARVQESNVLCAPNAPRTVSSRRARSSIARPESIPADDWAMVAVHVPPLSAVSIAAPCTEEVAQRPPSCCSQQTR